MLPDNEWNVTQFTNIRAIVGYFAQWSVRQLEFSHVPPNFTEVVVYLSESLHNDTIFDEAGWADLTLNDIEKRLRDILMTYQPFLQWNNFEVLADWIDLDALIRNVVIGIRDENRQYEGP